MSWRRLKPNNAHESEKPLFCTCVWMFAFKLANLDLTQSRFFWERVMLMLDLARNLLARPIFSERVPRCTSGGFKCRAFSTCRWRLKISFLFNWIKSKLLVQSNLKAWQLTSTRRWSLKSWARTVMLPSLYSPACTEQRFNKEDREIQIFFFFLLANCHESQLACIVKCSTKKRKESKFVVFMQEDSKI